MDIREHMTERRKVLKYLLGSAGVLTGICVHDELDIRPFKFGSSVAPIPTRKKYVRGQPSLSAGSETTYGRIIPNEDAVEDSFYTVPDSVSSELGTGFDSGFWVATLAILPNDSTFNPGPVKFRGESLKYYNAEITDSGNQNRDLVFHYVFHHWIRTLPIYSQPSSVCIDL
ncbi:hypothetical protein [Halorussus lipolyticus]|uniref:hypothetical protein n=1 Tax=Halorussus lipolyticus TaxID=3034024 RepID=UPI0023E7AC4D|nr:hypothetical protein [Halorussus sp. DT80]